MSHKVSNADELKEAALRYAGELGYKVFPVHGIDDAGNCTCDRVVCSHPGKHPVHNGGFKNATNDVEIINAWWTRYPGSNIGLPTGVENGVMAIDADEKTEGALEAFEKLDLPDGPRVKTGGGGVHAYMKYPDDFEVTTNTNSLRGTLDIRGRGGYVLMPPSNHKSGKRYEWEKQEPAPPPIPEWLGNELGASAARERFVLDEEIQMGTRDDTLFRLAASLRQTGLTEDEIYLALQGVNKRCKPPMEDHELRTKARSVAKYPKGQLQSPTGDDPFSDLDILSRDELDELEPPEWLIENIIPKESMSIVYGNPGQGKTFLVLDWCLSIATGKAFRGGNDTVHFPVEKGVVVYVAAEGARGIKTRVQAWEREHGIRATDLYVVQKAVQLAQKEHRDGLIEGLRHLSGTPILVVFDTLSRCMVGMDENSAQDVSLFIKSADVVRDELNCAVTIVHHSTKDGTTERGSSALRGAADAMYKVSRNDSRLIEMKCDKMKDAQEPDEQRFKTQVVELNHLGSPPSLILYPGSNNQRGPIMKAPKKEETVTEEQPNLTLVKTEEFQSDFDVMDEFEDDE